MKMLCTILSASILLSCNNTTDEEASDSVQVPAVIGYTVVKTYPHDTSSYTQGLIWYNNTLYEGTGRVGFSKLAKVDINTGKALQQQAISKSEFGEGITILNGKIYQLTWQNHKVHVYDVNTFKKIKEFNWPHDGWGITHDGKQLIVSTGSSNLYFVDPETFKIINTVGVTSQYGPVGNLNELEYIDGAIYSNIFTSNEIVKINPQSGRVEGIIDLKDIFQVSGKSLDANSAPDPAEDVLNGIAYNADTKTLYVTGKQWNTLFEIKLNQ